MKTVLDSVFAAVGAFLGFYFGGMNGAFIVLCVFAILDYLTGVASAVVRKELSSEIGFKGLLKKMLIFIFVGMGNLIDVYLVGSGEVVRTAVIFFYISNEGLSIIENAVEIGLPVPSILKKYFLNAHKNAEASEPEDKKGSKDDENS